MIWGEKCYLHRFGDASKKAYCATVYFLDPGTDGKTCVRVVASKTRVMPLKELSIPCLELMSARILAQLMDKGCVTVKAENRWHEILVRQQDILSWIQNRGEWKQYVCHRVNKILKLTAKEDWAYCCNDKNPADLGLRGVIASQLKEPALVVWSIVAHRKTTRMARYDRSLSNPRKSNRREEVDNGFIDRSRTSIRHRRCDRCECSQHPAETFLSDSLGKAFCQQLEGKHDSRDQVYWKIGKRRA